MGIIKGLVFMFHGFPQSDRICQKSEIRISKSETNSNFPNPNDQNLSVCLLRRLPKCPVFFAGRRYFLHDLRSSDLWSESFTCLEHLRIRISNLFRASDLEFRIYPFAYRSMISAVQSFALSPSPSSNFRALPAAFCWADFLVGPEPKARS